MTSIPRAQLSHLPRADGSATYSHGGYTVIGSANGPMEVNRRDEDPFASVVDVVVRPAAGVGGTRERHLEMILEATLLQLIPVKRFPRSLVQVVLQITDTPQDGYVNHKLVQAQQNLPVLPALIQTSILALLSAAVPLVSTATAALVAVATDGTISANPSTDVIRTAHSLHVFAYSSQPDPRTGKASVLLAQSEGPFSVGEWAAISAEARRVCCGDDADAGEGEGKRFVDAVVKEQISRELAWRK